MSGELQYLRQRIDEIADILAKNTVILERNTDSLQEHMRRTELLEKQLEIAIIPIKVAKWLGYIISLLGTAAGAILALKQVIGK